MCMSLPLPRFVLYEPFVISPHVRALVSVTCNNVAKISTSERDVAVKKTLELVFKILQGKSSLPKNDAPALTAG